MTKYNYKQAAPLCLMSHLSLLSIKHTKMRCCNKGINHNHTDTYHIECEGRLHKVMMENEFRMHKIVPDGTCSAELQTRDFADGELIQHTL